MSQSECSPGRDGRFMTTHWSLVLRASGRNGPDSSEALASLCELYWYPAYAFVRRTGYSADQSADLTQEFFTHMLEKSSFDHVTPDAGRFRSFLLACLRHFLSNERDRAQALKRQDHRPPMPMEISTAEGRYVLEPRDELTPERIFERRYALAILERALASLRDEQAAGGKERSFEMLKGFLTGDSAGISYAAVARSLGSTEGATKVAVHRLRRRFRDFLMEQVAATVDDPSEVREEIRYLLRAVSQ
jgi:RNA polymerase sigma factor (sigma-70 family)